MLKPLLEPSTMTDKFTLYDLHIIFNIDYGTMLQLRKEKLSSLKRKEYLSSKELEQLLIETKESIFAYTFEFNINESFIDRMLTRQVYDLKKEKKEWLEPRVLKFLLDVTPFQIQKLRNDKKFLFKEEKLPYRKSSSKNDFIFLYEKQSVIDYIVNNYGREKLRKTYIDHVISPQFLSVSKALEHIRNNNITISQVKVYRLIERNVIPANRFNESIRIPIKELDNLIADGGLI